jgi:hypothetical protein
MARRRRPDDARFYFLVALVFFAASIWHAVDGWVQQERWLTKYPVFPETWYDFGLYEFYAYNRYTCVLLALAGIVCVVLSAESRWREKHKKPELLDELTQIRRQRRK